MAFKEAAKKSSIKILEPIMKLEITAPESSIGDIIGDISGRRGSVVEVNTGAGDNITKIIANAPLAELFGYATALRSITKGRASYSMEPSNFECVPSIIQQQIVEKK